MDTPAQLAKHFKEVHFGGNWTAVNLREQLADVDWELANKKVGELNTIAVLVYHMNYYVSAVLKVLEGGTLKARDAHSFNMPSLKSREDWENLMAKVFEEAELFASLVEQLPEAQLSSTFEDEKYGTYHRNLMGIIEHCHYHLGQITLIKKILTGPK